MSLGHRKSLVATVLLSLALCAYIGGCKSQEQEISEAAHLLGKQHEAWNLALEGCKKGQADVGQLRNVGEYLISRTSRRVEIDYNKPNKAEVLALLKELGQSYSENIMNKMVPTMSSYALAPGVTNQSLCDAFLAMNDRYQKLVEMTK